MNFGVGKKYSIFLMSLRENAPYADALDPVTGMLTYEGHDEPQRQGGPNRKEVDQPLTTPKGSWTENGKFWRDWRVVPWCCRTDALIFLVCRPPD
jgi:hypothetical protein